VIFCEIIVHLLVIVQNNKRCTGHVLKYWRRCQLSLLLNYHLGENNDISSAAYCEDSC
jgi:hypothetical protein